MILVRRELLDHVIVLSQNHLNRLLREYIDQYYHTGRPHQGLNGHTPVAAKKPRVVNGPIHLISFRVCGGLKNRYGTSGGVEHTHCRFVLSVIRQALERSGYLPFFTARNESLL